MMRDKSTRAKPATVILARATDNQVLEIQLPEDTANHSEEETDQNESACCTHTLKTENTFILLLLVALPHSHHIIARLYLDVITMTTLFDSNSV